MNRYLDIDVFESLGERWDAVGWDALTDAERECLGAETCIGQVSNGGLHQFLTNADPPMQAAAKAGLARVGAARLAKVLGRAMKLFPGGTPPASAEKRWDLLKGEMDNPDGPLERLDAEFTRVWQADEDVSALVRAYAEAHPEQFKGPRNRQELIASRAARGAEPPERLKKLQRDAEADAKRTNDRCPTCGQPMPSYRKTCKACGRPRG
jgi:hypothetical protein